MQGNNADPPEPSTDMDKLVKGADTAPEPHNCEDKPAAEVGRLHQLRERLHANAHRAHGAFWEGAGYQLGTGAVSLLILWVQSRH